MNSNAVVNSKPNRGILVAGSIGSLVDWYNFFVALTAAAIVFPAIFFPSTVSVAVATAVSVATVGITYASRLVGAVLFGHFGDKIGRRSTLFATLLLGVISALGIGLTPGYASLGYVSLALIIIFRLLYGIGLGGEFGAATTWVGEHANDIKHRTLWSMMPMQMSLVGASMAVATFATLLGYTSHSFFITEGWRYAFYITAAMAAIGLIIRYYFSESPLFEKKQQAKEIEKVPLIPLFKHNWKKIMLYGFSFLIAIATVTIILIPYTEIKMEAAAVHSGMASFVALYYLALALLLSVIPSTLSYLVSDRIGRVNSLLIANVGTGVFVFPFLFIINGTTSLPLMALVVMVLYSFSTSGNGGIPMLLLESFDTKYRVSGMGITYQMSAVYAGIVTGIIVPAVVVAYGGYANAGVGMASILLGLSIVGTIVALVMRKGSTKSFKRDLNKDEDALPAPSSGN